MKYAVNVSKRVCLIYNEMEAMFLISGTKYGDLFLFGSKLSVCFLAPGEALVACCHPSRAPSELECTVGDRGLRGQKDCTPAAETRFVQVSQQQSYMRN